MAPKSPRTYKARTQESIHVPAQIRESDLDPRLGGLYHIRGRYFFNDDRSIIELPEMIEVQLESYKYFLDHLLNQAFVDAFPIDDFSGEKVSIYYKSLSIEEPKYSISECKRKNLNYEAPFKAKFEMLNKVSGEIKEQEVYMGGVPLMTEQGTFIVNGVERVIVNQIIRSNGIFMVNDAKTVGSFAMKIIPAKGSWFEIEIEKKGAIMVKVDKKRKIPVTVLLRAHGLESDAEIIQAFSGNPEFLSKHIGPTIEKDKTKSRLEALYALYKLIRPGDLGTDERVEQLFATTFFDIKKFDLGEVARMKIKRKFGVDIAYEGDGRFLQLADLVEGLKYLMSLQFRLPGFSVDDIDHLENRRVRSVGELVSDRIKVGITRLEKIAKDRMTILELDDATPGTFINARPVTAVLKEFFGTSQLSQFMDQSNPLSELANKRRLTALGNGGLTRERAGFEVRDIHPTQYGRICPLATPEGQNIGLVLHFASYARVDKYGFITTPFRKLGHSVANDGISSVHRVTREALLDAKGEMIIDEKMLITAEIAQEIKSRYPHEEIWVRAYLTDTVEYFDAYEEKDLIIAEANAPVDEHGNFLETRVAARRHFEATTEHLRQVTYIDISPKQIFSESSSLIPFLEHDDATRAEMATNMMRQAVPLIRAEAPVVGTGMERQIGEASGYVIKAIDHGQVIGVDGKHITVIYDNGQKVTHELMTFERSNHDMLVHQKPLVSAGQRIEPGDILADGQSIEDGELAIGRNLVVAYMPWGGYNFEDSIILSSRVMQDDYYTSVHITEYIMDVRETKLGPEQTTSDIPNVSATKLRNLDENGIIRVGSTVEAGDILVGKVTPKGEMELSPEERLLRAIFGDKSKDVKDSSLVMPIGTSGKVIGVHILRRENGDSLSTGVFEEVKVFVAQTRKIEVGDKMAGRHGNKGIVSRIMAMEDMPYMADGTPIDIVLNPHGVISRMNIGQILEAHLGLAARKLGIKVATPVLNGLSIEQIDKLMEEAGIDSDGKCQLFDGRTGDAFKERTFVGLTYMLKLHHLVEDKIHARSVGPYSMVTQQPLGGKAQRGGQRLGEMEVWALEGYGAANILQEMLTIKSDDINGRAQAYEAVVKKKPIKRPNMPESFNVLLRELQALNLQIELLDKEGIETIETEQAARYDELERLEGQFDIEVDIPTGDAKESAAIPVTSGALSDEV